MNGFDLFQILLSTKAHFNNPESYNMNNGLLHVKYETFLKKNERLVYEGVATDVLNNSKHNGIQFCVANQIHYPEFWIGDAELEDVWHKWQQRNQSLIDTIIEDLMSLNGESGIINTMIFVDGKNPIALTKYTSGKISPETMCCIWKGFDLKTKWAAIAEFNPLYTSVANQLLAYSKFYDCKKLLNHPRIKEVLATSLNPQLYPKTGVRPRVEELEI